MDVSDLRQKILRALEASRLESANKRTEADIAKAAFENLLTEVVVPLLQQAQNVLKAERHMFTVHSPAGSARLVSDANPETFLEFVLDTTGGRPQVLSRSSVARGAKRVSIDEQPVGTAKTIQELTEQDFATLLVATIPKLVK